MRRAPADSVVTERAVAEETPRGPAPLEMQTGSHRCYNARSLVVMTDAANCVAVGLLDEPPSATERRRVCTDTAGQTIYVSADQQCEPMGYIASPLGVVELQTDPPAPVPASGSVQVHGYTRANGTRVAPHTRRR